ncbi:hypothetical protein XELAEV_18038640mg [Xenopus laevis]|uniref:Uncharacterized protein n=1 Tax=Xenopus laevis TaxID=8355 RepID=A0A974C5Y6_XENLA|nr:hypothetical protein XELAEV_18038640mg [Xenopus laevis]
MTYLGSLGAFKLASSIFPTVTAVDALEAQTAGRPEAVARHCKASCRGADNERLIWRNSELVKIAIAGARII